MPWSDLKGTYVPEVYEQYTQDYIDLCVSKHQKLANDCDSDYVFVNSLDECIELFDQYQLPRVSSNDIFNIKFMLLDKLFDQYEYITYIDFDVIHKGTPTSKDIRSLTQQEFSVHYSDPIPDMLVHRNVRKLCNYYDVPIVRPIWQNNNGVITVSKQGWKKLNYLDCVKMVYADISWCEEICDESMLNFITLYNCVQVKHLPADYNTLVRSEEEFARRVANNNDFQMMHFTKHTGKQVLNQQLRDSSSILYQV